MNRRSYQDSKGGMHSLDDLSLRWQDLQHSESDCVWKGGAVRVGERYVCSSHCQCLGAPLNVSQHRLLDGLSSPSKLWFLPPRCPPFIGGGPTFCRLPPGACTTPASPADRRLFCLGGASGGSWGSQLALYWMKKRKLTSSVNSNLGHLYRAGGTLLSFRRVPWRLWGKASGELLSIY